MQKEFSPSARQDITSWLIKPDTLISERRKIKRIENKVKKELKKPFQFGNSFERINLIK